MSTQASAIITPVTHTLKSWYTSRHILSSVWYTPESEHLVLLMRNWEWFLLLVIISRPFGRDAIFQPDHAVVWEPWVVTGR